MERTADNAAPLEQTVAQEEVRASKPQVMDENSAEAANKQEAAQSVQDVSANDIQKFLADQSPASAKRLIFSATKTTTTRTMSKTVSESVSHKQTKEVFTAANMAHMGWKASKEAFLAHSSSFASQNDATETEIARFVPSVQVVDLPLDLVYTVPEVKTRMVNYTFECPARGYSRLVPRAFPVDTPFIVPQYEDVRVPVVMSQTFVPELQETSKVVQVPVARYVPKLVPVDVFVPRPVAIPIKAGEVTQVTKNTVISEDLMHQLSVEMNPHLQALNKFNAQQAQAMDSLVNKANELATQMDCPPPAPERIEVNEKACGVIPVVDEQGNKQLKIDLGGKDPRSVEMVFKRLHDDADTSKSVEETVQLTEDIILCVHRDLNGGRLDTFPSGNAGIPMIFRAPDEKQGFSACPGSNGLPEPAPLRSLTNDMSLVSASAEAQNDSSATTTGESVPAALGAEEATTAVPIAA
ncbi:putative articulin 4 [Neospora caninum Liverpool]|uniref:Articulin 4, putative n=1 Tax=Neospora caninum (strain Liverpool) TaxID=572307 RepID=F0V8P5_NEOCL|nr:putative articulin 4 [Neospora caninum Liverpool]CBZ50086.1 putative articulin 4 [Neospora caninum Liverpool]CEL64681.1 TPA: articulin 4, putative [Neospora caninum Liverpool]|eukprot:XP_003880121.1 putative articulin 4 [Neospora caninum Liverpool]